MEQKKFSLNAILLSLFFIPIGLINLYLVWELNYPAIKALQINQSLPRGWSWPSLFILDVIILVSAFLLFKNPITELRTIFTTNFIKRQEFHKSTLILWSEITKIEILGWRLKLTSPNHAITVNLAVYKNPKDVIAFIMSLVPESVKTQFESQTNLSIQ